MSPVCLSFDVVVGQEASRVFLVYIFFRQNHRRFGGGVDGGGAALNGIDDNISTLLNGI